MKAIITTYKIENTLETIGDDFTSIHIFFKIESNQEIRIPFIVSYDKLVESIASYDNDAANYLKKIRSSMHGYGPKHSKVFKVMEEENFDLEPHIYKYVELIDEKYILQHVEWCDRINLLENKKTIETINKELSDVIDENYKNYNIRYVNFQDAIDKALHETTLKYFPELFEKGQKHIAAYKDELINITLKFTSEIDKLTHDKFNLYWEEKYNETNKKLNN